MEFIFTAPTFIAEQATDKLKKEHREFQIPKTERERSLYGSAFELQLKNKLTQRAIARECADWIKRKVKFRSNRGKSPMQQFAYVNNGGESAVYLPLHGFTAVDLGFQKRATPFQISYTRCLTVQQRLCTSTYLSRFGMSRNALRT